jgi:catechol 2,3-dioxygenase-like lactoylglutathione lyase family enzyme
MNTDPSSLAAIPPHAVLRAADLERARAFYAETLGLAVDIEEPPARELRVHAGGSMICVYERPGSSAPENTTVCFDVPDVEARVHELRGRGVAFEEYDNPESGLVTIEGVATVNGRKRAWFKDSEGNVLVIGESGAM